MSREFFRVFDFTINLQALLAKRDITNSRKFTLLNLNKFYLHYSIIYVDIIIQELG